MFFHSRLIAIAALASIALFATRDARAAFQPTDQFTFQARLDENGVPKTGTVDLRFDAFSQETGGSPLTAETMIHDGVPLVNGVFTVQVSFGRRFFTGVPIFVQVGVREDAAGDASTLIGFTDLMPRHALTATPFANYAEIAASVQPSAIRSEQISDGSITAADANTTSTTDGLQRRVFSGCATNSAIRVINADGTVDCEVDDVGTGAAAWGLTGNSGTNPALNFIGTTDAQPLVLRAENVRVGHLERVDLANGDRSVNVLLGDSGNVVDAGVIGATIAGGGGVTFLSSPVGPVPIPRQNRVSGEFGSIGGGTSNVAGRDSVVGGGVGNEAQSRSVVAGGQGNRANGFATSIGGGSLNLAGGTESVVGGGRSNAAAGERSIVPGGLSALAGGDFSFAAGRRAKVRSHDEPGSLGTGEPSTCSSTGSCGDEGTFLWADSQDSDFISQGPNQFLIRATGGLGIQPGNGSLQELANAPEAPLHVFKGSAGTVTATASDTVAVFENSGAAFVRILAPGGVDRGILLGHPADQSDGGIVYTNTDVLQLRAGGNVTRLAVEADGSVGIGTGTTAVGNTLHVMGGGTGSLPGGHSVQFQNTATTTTNSLLALKSTLTGNVGSATNFVTFFDGDNDANGAIEGNGAGGVVYKTSGADYAEWLPRVDASESIAPGELVGLHAGGRVSKRLDGAMQVLIASTGAAVAGNSPGESPEDTHTLIAFVGQVQARVCGAVRAGDAIVAAENGSGCGLARDPKQLGAHEFARIAGTAWESAPGEGEHRVRVAVGLGDGGAERASLLSRIDALEAKLSTQQALVDALLARAARAVVTSARQASGDGFE